jgi:hypothetical protein
MLSAFKLGFLYSIYILMAYVTFGVDVSAVEDAKKITCPTGYSCTYDPFNACVVLDFMGATILAIYVIWEYFLSKRPKQIGSQNIIVQ